MRQQRPRRRRSIDGILRDEDGDGILSRLKNFNEIFKKNKILSQNTSEKLHLLKFSHKKQTLETSRPARTDATSTEKGWRPADVARQGDAKNRTPFVDGGWVRAR